MQEIGRKIFYDLTTGEVLIDTGERRGLVMPTTVEQDIKTYKALSERNSETFDVLELEYGAYAADFTEAQLKLIDPETKELRFEYPNLEDPEEPIIPEKPLSKQIEELKEEGVMNMMAMTEMYEKNVKLEEEGASTMLAVTELYEILTGGD